MSSTSDKITGLSNQAKGSIKEGVGKMVDNPKLEAEGVVQKHVGKAQHAVGEAKDAVKKAVDKA